MDGLSPEVKRSREREVGEEGAEVESKKSATTRTLHKNER